MEWRIYLLLQIFRDYHGSMSNVLQNARSGYYQITKLSASEFDELLTNIDKILKSEGYKYGIIKPSVTIKSDKLHWKDSGNGSEANV